MLSQKLYLMELLAGLGLIRLVSEGIGLEMSLQLKHRMTPDSHRGQVYRFSPTVCALIEQYVYTLIQRAKNCRRWIFCCKGEHRAIIDGMITVSHMYSFTYHAGVPLFCIRRSRVSPAVPLRR